MKKKLLYYPLFVIFAFSITQIPNNVILAGDAGTMQINPSIVAQLADQQLKEKNQLPVNELDQRVDTIKSILDQLFSIVSGLTHMIHDNQISTIKNKEEALVNLKEMSKIIQLVQSEKFVDSNVAALASTIKLTHAILNHIKEALDNGFETVRPFDIQSYMLSQLIKKSKNPKPESLEFIDRALHVTNKNISQLRKKAEKAGLHWYNHLYRAFDSTIINPGVKYNIPFYATLGGSAAFSALWLWWRLDHGRFKTVTEKVGLYRLFGPVPQLYSGTMKNPANEEFNPSTPFSNLGPVGKIDKLFYEISNKSGWTFEAALGVLATGAAMLYKQSAAKLAKNMRIIHNTLKGGAYLKEAGRHANQIDMVRFSDIVGNEKGKEYFTLLLNYLENPESYDRLGLTPQKGCLLIGETRTGKTFLVNALYNELEIMLARQGRSQEIKFLRLDAPTINMNGIKYLFEQIKQFAPCIIFIDEIDLLDLQRKGQNDKLSELLQWMSDITDAKDPKNQVIIIAATNRPETLDKALRQPGRFGKEIRFEYPSYKDRVTFISRKLDKLSLDVSSFDVEKIAAQTDHKSYETLKMLIDAAVLKARIHGHILTQADIDQALDEELRQVSDRGGKEIPVEEKRIIAAHYAGHAASLILSKSPIAIARVTTHPVTTPIKEEHMAMHLFRAEDKKRFEHGGIFITHAVDSIGLVNKQEQITLCKFHLAGFIAEELLLGSCGYSCHTQDTNDAFNIALLLANQGLELKDMPDAIKVEAFKKAEALINLYKQELTQLFTANKEKLERVYNELLEKQLLSGEQIIALMQ